MGVASYREDDLTRFLEATEVLPIFGPPAAPAPPRHHCPFCAETFGNRRTLSHHLASSHHGERPVLMIGGREPDQTLTIRQHVRATEISIENCSAARVRLNGTLQREVPPKAVPKLLSRQTDAVIDVELINSFDEVALPIKQSYCLILCIPDKASLDAVDRAFIKHLATGMPQMAQVATFLGDRLCRGPASDYAEALGSYVRGLLVKDQAPDTGVTLPPAEADDLYGAALERDRAAWSRACTSRQKELEEVDRRLEELGMRFTRLRPADQSEAQTLEDEWKRWWHELSKLTAVPAIASNAASSEALAGIESALKGLEALRGATERRLDAAMRAREVAATYGSLVH